MGEEYEGEVEVEDDSQPIAEGLPTSDQWWVLSDAVHLDGFRARVVCNTGSPRARAAHECELRGWLEMVGSPGEDAAMWRPTPLGEDVARRTRAELARQDDEYERQRERRGRG